MDYSLAESLGIQEPYRRHEEVFTIIKAIHETDDLSQVFPDPARFFTYPRKAVLIGVNEEQEQLFSQGNEDDLVFCHVVFVDGIKIATPRQFIFPTLAAAKEGFIKRTESSRYLAEAVIRNQNTVFVQASRFMDYITDGVK